MLCRFKELREHSNYTQQQIADILEIKLRTWQSYEQGISEPKYDLLVKIADLFDVSIDYIFYRKSPEPKSLDGMAIEKKLNRVERAVIEAFITADTDGRASIIDFAKKVAKAEAEARENFIIQDMTAEEYEREVMSRVNADAEKEEKASG